MIFQFIVPRLTVDHQALRDPQRFIPSHKGIYLFPEWLEDKLRPLDDWIIEMVQLTHSPFIAFLAQIVSMVYSVEFAAFFPYAYLFLGWDRAILHTLSQCIVLLILSQLPKRFIWRYRPYMVNRAKMGASDKTSSFPARTVTCGVVFSYIIHQTYLSYYEPSTDTTLFIFYMIITLVYTLTALVTSASRIELGAHYPSDCVMGIVQGTVSCCLGDALYSLMMSCPKDIIHANELVPWNWSNIDYNHFVIITVIGFVFILVSGIKSLSLWEKLPLINSLLFPSIVFNTLVCTTPLVMDTNWRRAHYLVPIVLSAQHYVILVCLFGGVLVTYKYLQLKRLTVAGAVYYLVAHLSLLAILMVHRLHPPVDHVNIKNGIGDIDMNT